MRRNIGSRITKAAGQFVQDTAIGSKAVDVPRPARRVVRGSSAGLQNQSSARLLYSEGGYLNPANQLARRSGKTPMISQVRLNRNYNGNIRTSFMDNRTMPRRGGSADILSRLM